MKNWKYFAFVVALGLLSSAVPVMGQTPGGATVAHVGDENARAPKATDPAALVEELSRLREIVERQEQAIEALRKELDRRVPEPMAATTEAVPAVAAAAAVDEKKPDDELKAKVDELTKRWGKLKLSGDIQLRSESFWSQGFDGPALEPRNRLRYRARLNLTGEISENFDWGLRLASGSFDNPISPQQTTTDFYNRKPIGIDRAFIHYDSKTDNMNFEVVAGKFDPTWRRTSLSFDQDVQVEGLSETLRFDTGTNTPLRAIKVIAWQLPYRERAIGADALLFGGQLAADLRFSNTWRATVAGAFHDFEQVDVIPPATGVSPTLVNAGFDYPTTNTVVINPVTNLPEYRSEFRVIDSYLELEYTGLADKWPVLMHADWLHNTSAFNNQKDGGTLDVLFGRRQERHDLAVEYVFWKAEREVFPSVFMDSEMVIQTNNVSHAVKGSFMLHKQVEFDVRFLRHRRLATSLPENRWLNHLQFDVNYRF